MRRLICNYLKIIFRSPLYRLAYLFCWRHFLFFPCALIFICRMIRSIILTAFNAWNTLNLLCILWLFVWPVFFAQKPSLLEEICFVPRKKICLSHLYTYIYFGSCNGSFHCVDLSDNWGGCRACDDFLLVENYFICILSLGTDSKLDDNDRIFLRLDCHKQICIFVFHSVYVTVFGFNHWILCGKGNFGV